MEPTSSEYKFLSLLAKEYPTRAAAAAEIINLQAILKLPKPTEHFMSDLHGEADAFTHILSNASGVIREKADRVLGTSVPEQERAEFATLIYYPAQKLAQLKPRQTDLAAFYRTTLYRLIDTCRVTASKYTRSFVRKRLPKTYAYILDELLHAHFEDHDKDLYYGSILTTIINTGEADHFIIALCELIRNLAVHRLHIVGDVFDRGARPDVIMDELLSHHAADVQWGNHDVQWMGAAAGSDICIAGVIRVALAYNNLETLEDGYGINLRPLALFAEEVYRNTDIAYFYPKITDDGDYSPVDMERAARMHKAVSILLFKLECALVHRNPEFGMLDRALLETVDFTSQTVVVDGTEYRMRDCDFPTVDPKDPARLTPEEKDVLAKLRLSFAESEKLQRHVRFLYAQGSMYRIENGNLLYHGAVPMRMDGTFDVVTVDGVPYSGRTWMDYCERMARQGYFAPEGSAQRRKGQDFLYYLWCGRQSPVFGRFKMATFEHFFIEEEAAHTEKKNAYYRLIENEDEHVAAAAAGAILKEFGLDPARGHIINGHVPVRAKNGEVPVKAGGRVIVIDGGFCRAYHDKTGIAGYTLVSSSRGLSLRCHSAFESAQKAISENRDILSSVDIFEKNSRRLLVGDTDNGQRLKEQIADLERLCAAYADGTLVEKA